MTPDITDIDRIRMRQQEARYAGGLDDVAALLAEVDRLTALGNALSHAIGDGWTAETLPSWIQATLAAKAAWDNR